MRLTVTRQSIIEDRSVIRSYIPLTPMRSFRACTPSGDRTGLKPRDKSPLERPPADGSWLLRAPADMWPVFIPIDVGRKRG